MGQRVGTIQQISSEKQTNHSGLANQRRRRRKKITLHWLTVLFILVHWTLENIVWERAVLYRVCSVSTARVSSCLLKVEGNFSINKTGIT